MILYSRIEAPLFAGEGQLITISSPLFKTVGVDTAVSGFAEASISTVSE